MRGPLHARVFAFAAIVAIALLPSCTLTLPFDELTDRTGGPLPKLHFKLDETTGDTAVDALGSKTLASVIDEREGAPQDWWVPARRGNGLSCRDLRVLGIEALSSSSFPQRATFAFWTKISEPPAQNDANDLLLVSEVDTVPMAVYETLTSISFDRSTGEEDDEVVKSSKVAIPGLDVWILVVVGWDIGAGQTLLYRRVDGQPESQLQRGDFPPGFTITNPFLELQAANGILDDVKFWDRLLTAEELEELD